MTFKVIQGHWKLLNQEAIQHFLLVVCSNITINLHTKFEMSSFIWPKIWLGPQNVEMGHITLTTPTIGVSQSSDG